MASWISPINVAPYREKTCRTLANSMIQVLAKHVLGESEDESTSGDTDVIRDGSEIYQFSREGSAKCSWSFQERGCCEPQEGVHSS